MLARSHLSFKVSQHSQQIDNDHYVKSVCTVLVCSGNVLDMFTPAGGSSAGRGVLVHDADAPKFCKIQY